MKPISQNASHMVTRVMFWGLTLLLVVMPFHAFLSIVLGNFLGHEAVFQSWKELLFVVLAGLWLYSCWREKRFLLRWDVTNIAALSIIILGLIVSGLQHPSTIGFLFGVKTDLVPIGLFLIAQAYGYLFDDNRLMRLVLLPAIAVAALALVQVTIVPSQLLALLGYSAQTINPLQLVDASGGLVRAFATLGGPNQLGTYLILPATLALAALIKTKKWVFLPTLLILATGIGLSFSRSSWLGAATALIVAALISLSSKLRLLVLGGLIIVGVLGASIVVPGLSNSKNVILQNLFLHGQFYQEKTIGPPDVRRSDALVHGFVLTQQQPWGHGLGTAGPASYHNDTQLIVENWYLQIAYELGLAGLLAYLVFFTSLIIGFMRQKSSSLQVGLVAGLIGILVASLFLHSLADSTLALISFIVFGLYKGNHLAKRTPAKKARS